MPEILPLISAETGLIPLWDGYMDTQPMWYPVFAGEINTDSTASHTGTHDHASGEIRSVGTIHAQDTYLSGSTGTGLEFTGVTSGLRSDWVSPETGKFGILCPDGGDGATFETYQTLPDAYASVSGYRKIIVGRGMVNPSSSRTPASIYTKLELNYGSTNGEYRVVMAYGSLFSLEYRSPGLTQESDWKRVGYLPSAVYETYLEQHNRRISVFVEVDKINGKFGVRLGDGKVTWVKPENGLPTVGCVRLTGKNGYATLEVYPMRFQSVRIQTRGPQVDTNTPIANAQIVPNTALGDDSDLQVDSSSVSTDDLGRLVQDITFSKSDAGDDEGSDEPVRIANVMTYIPAVFSYYNGTMPPSDIRTTKIQETQKWDDVNRIGWTEGTLYFDNTDGRYSGYWGNYALAYSLTNLNYTNGTYDSAQRFRGMFGVGSDGIRYKEEGAVHIGWGRFHDNTLKLHREAGQRIVLDGLAVPTAVRLLLTCAGIHPGFQVFIPNYGLGPYGDLVNVPILPKGTGTSPRLEYSPTTPIISILLDILRNFGEVSMGWNPPWTTTVAPYMFWQDSLGYFHLAPYVPGLPVAEFDTANPMVGGQVTSFEVSNSIENLRTDVICQGQDALSYELLHYHTTLPQNRFLVGYPYPAVERSPQFVDSFSTVVGLKSLAAVCSLPSQFVYMTVEPARCKLFAGNQVLITDNRLIGTRLYTILSLTTEQGLEDPMESSGTQVSRQHFICRSADADRPR